MGQTENYQAPLCIIQYISVERGSLKLEGFVETTGGRCTEVKLSVNEREYFCDFLREDKREEESTDIFRQFFQMTIPLKDKSHTVAFWGMDRQLEAGFGSFVPLDAAVNFYYCANGWIVFYQKKNHTLQLLPDTPAVRGRRWIARNLSFLSMGIKGVKALAVRGIYGCMKPFKKNIWLVSDRVDAGDDNGEVFFEYLCRQREKGIKPCFVISKTSSDYDRINALGEVIEPFSWKHKLYHLLSQFLVSSQGNFAVVNPFGRYGRNYKDIMWNQRFVFLQHGVTKDNQSKWLNRYNRNIYGFVVTTRPEYDSVFAYDYFYNADNVWLTGMPRYDRLYNDTKKYITIMPTWRKSLSPGADGRGVWQVQENFNESEYFQFYNNLLNHEGLIRRAGELGYTLCFVPHPNTRETLGMFTRNKEVKFLDGTKTYREIFAETDLLVTDYSSVAFDFAYLKKPVIYCQFDHEEFFSGTHSYTQGYYDYERDGFGEIEYTLDHTVQRIIEYMENGCRMKPVYRKRIQSTFPFHDNRCCERILNKMLEKQER